MPVPAQITNFKCPSCTGPLRYDGESGRVVCDYCGGSFSVQKIEALYHDKIEDAQQAAAAATASAAQQGAAEQDWGWNAASDDWGAAGADMRAYTCPSCGAELICDSTTVATQCPYCGNPTVVPSQFDGSLKPDYILPFRLDKEAAVKALTEFYRDKKLLPKAFASANQIEKIQGVYVPFWLFSGTAEVDMSFAATRSMTHREGDRIITETDHFQLRRAGNVDFERIPVDGSRRMPDAHMDAIEPFDYSALKPFSPGYLPGFLANKFDVEQDECARRADERAARTAEQVVAATANGGFATCVPTGKSIRLRRGEVRYALLPVWMLSTRWNDQNFLFAMNGQTGRLIGDLPVSKRRYWGYFAGIALPVAGALAALLYFFL